MTMYVSFPPVERDILPSPAGRDSVVFLHPCTRPPPPPRNSCHLPVYIDHDVFPSAPRERDSQLPRFCVSPSVAQMRKENPRPPPVFPSYLARTKPALQGNFAETVDYAAPVVAIRGPLWRTGFPFLLLELKAPRPLYLRPIPLGGGRGGGAERTAHNHTKMRSTNMLYVATAPASSVLM